jgi:hypothetical protein
MSAAPRFWWAVGGVSVLALWASSSLYATTTLGLAGPKEPEAGGPLPDYVESYLAYRGLLFPFEQWQNWTLALALLGIGLIAAGLFLRSWDGGAAISARLGALAVGCGALVAAVAQVAYLGTVERMFAVTDIAFFDTGSLATMVDVATRTDDYVENLGLLMMAVGLIMLAWTRGPWSDRPRGIRAASRALAVGLAAVAAATFSETALADPVMLVVGFAVAPAWMLIAVRTLNSRSSSMIRG